MPRYNLVQGSVGCNDPYAKLIESLIIIRALKSIKMTDR